MAENLSFWQQLALIRKSDSVTESDDENEAESAPTENSGKLWRSWFAPKKESEDKEGEG